MKKYEKVEMTKSSVFDEDMKKYKNMVLDIMKDFHVFMKIHGIKYSLAFGTLLGAIRHNGYIPWDDDIDIILTNEEFHKLLEVVDQFNSDKYLVVKPLDDSPFAFSRLIKVYDKRACMKEYGVATVGGPFIDVFSTIDVENKNNFKKEADEFRFYTSLYSFKTGRVNAQTYLGGHPYIFKMISLLYSKRCLKKKIKAYYDKNGSRWCISSFGSPIVYDKAWFDSYEPHKFEQYEFDIVKDYDAMLKSEFNDYMNLPPVEKRNAHHLEEISFTESFVR